MRFQVLLPVYNASLWFEEALASIAGHHEGEVLIIDDGSRDEEREKIASICSKFSGVRFFAEPHRGLVGTLNFGLSIATAQYIARMDADDVCLPGRFDKQLVFLDAHPDIAVIGGQMIGMDRDGKPNGKTTRYPTTPDTIASHLMKWKNPFSHPSVMMRREAVIAVGGYRPATEYAEDYDLWLRLVERYQLANLSEPIMWYRRHEMQITRSTNWKQKFAHDLGTLSARRRRAGKIDPLNEIKEPLIWTKISSDLDDEIQKLTKAYRVLATNSLTASIAADEISSILFGINSGFLGRSSKPQAKAAAKATQLALRNSKYALAIEAIIKGLRLNPVAFAVGLTS